MSVPANAWGSVVGNALERGYGYTPYGENTKNICGMEIVLPNGEMIRTGTGAMSNSPCWQLFKYGFGPSWDQVFVQSNYGVVTKMGMWLMPEPEATLGLNMQLPNPDDVGWAVDALQPLRMNGVLQQNPSIGNSLRVVATQTPRSQWYRRRRRAAGRRPAHHPQQIQSRLVGNRPPSLSATTKSTKPTPKSSKPPSRNTPNRNSKS